MPGRSGARPGRQFRGRRGRTAERHVNADGDEDLLVAVLDEVIYGMDAKGEVPVSVTVRRVSCSVTVDV